MTTKDFVRNYKALNSRYSFAMENDNGKKVVIENTTRFSDFFDNLGEYIMDNIVNFVVLNSKNVDNQREAKEYLFNSSSNEEDFEKAIELGRKIMEIVEEMGGFETEKQFEEF